VYVWPNSDFNGPELYELMQQPGYRANVSWTDVFSVMTYFNDYSLGIDDTLTVFSALVTQYSGSYGSYIDRVDKARQWFADNVISDLTTYECGDANGNGSIDIDDVVFLIAYIFQGGPPPVPVDAGDANCSGGVDIDDVVYIINYIFMGGPAPCALCK